MSFEEPDATGNNRDNESEEPRLPTRRTDPDAVSPASTASTAPWLEKPFPSLTSRLLPAKTSTGQRRPRRWLRRSLIQLGCLLLLAFVALVIAGVWLRHSMHAALPQLDGELHAPGLSAAVTVTRDAQGVPSLQASNLDDLLFAQGYVTAQDRLWQMDALRRHAAGDLAEILGSKLVEHDRTQRILQLRATAERAVDALPADQRHQLETYARGVNAFIDQNGDHLPVEFHLLHYKPEPWTPRDSLLVSLAMFQELSTGFPTKMRREALMAHLPAELIADLYPVGSWRDHPPGRPSPNLTTPKPEIEEIPLDDTQAKLHAPHLAEPRDVLRVHAPGDECEGCRAGSNNWVVAASHSASGFPLVSNDMHLTLSVPDIWYEAGLHCPAANGDPGLDVTGFTLPGAPFVIVGRNAHVAWGFTNLGADVQDVRVEHTRGSGDQTEYQKPDGTWTTVGHRTEFIHVRGGHDVTLDVLTTTATIGNITIVTPVITPLYPTEQRTLSLAWTAYDPINLSVPLLAADTASDGASLVAAMASFGGPSLNLIYADDARHIGYHALGRIPVRGPAGRKLRQTLLPPVINGSAPADEDGDEPSPQARLSDGGLSRKPFLLEAAYRPTRHRAHPRQAEPPPHRPKPVVDKAPEEAAIPLPPPPIGYTVGNPVSNVPIDALNSGDQWTEYIPYSELPAVTDPPDGVLATANARITADDSPYSLADDWVSPYRVERIYKLLSGRSGLTPADMLAVQNDIHSEYDLVIAQRLAYAVDHASPAVTAKDAQRLHQASDILRRWDGSVAADSPAAAIVLSFRNQIWQTLLVPQIVAHDHGQGNARPEEIALLYQWEGQAAALEDLLEHQPARWLPQGVANWNDLLAGTLARGLSAAHAPSNLSTWRYGHQHPVEIAHPVFSLLPAFDRILGTPTGTGLRETGGDGNTIKAIALHFGPSERFTADLANPDTSFGNIATGQSGNPSSDWYLDQFLPWLHGTSFPLPLHPTAGRHTLTLLP
ncbi:MAG TPA: penicillin acylase family protein [Acidobacteriaceae bacterium]|jgi:penicillin amidase